ncbi:hypothetical protein RF11_06757 [Thelohanellus kitauei]|uniref:Uncharacterized protein n=1 Tax=Thelohanellus kitauei TaxID=669202 RepID=A0A0C2IS86_THEKT|nr:hypothetical protein RF11_06757 [Thelohanellus kitauei]
MKVGYDLIWDSKSIDKMFKPLKEISSIHSQFFSNLKYITHTFGDVFQLGRDIKIFVLIDVKKCNKFKSAYSFYLDNFNEVLHIIDDLKDENHRYEAFTEVIKF